MPCLVATLARLGFNLKIRKTCILGLQAPGSLGCLPLLQHVSDARFVGMILQVSAGDAHQIDQLRRSSASLACLSPW